ncbi:MAG: malonic semialdehyde reductase [Pseudomonadota bacterium]
MAYDTPLPASAQEQVFTEARTRNGWLDKPVTDEQIEAIYDLMKWGPTSANCQPMRTLFLRTQEAKEKLKPLLMEGNQAKAMEAPVVAIIGYEMEFYEELPEQFPHTDAKAWFAGNDPLIEETAIRNGTLQGAYLMVAARMMGLDCGPMSGFDKAGVDEAFFAGTTIKSNWICTIGYGSDKDLFPRSPRLAFQKAATLL